MNRDPHKPVAVDSAQVDAVAPVQAVVGQLDGVIERLSAEQYTRNPVGSFHSSVGGHVRHCLDHVDALLRGVDGGEVDYDQRQRGTAVESDPNAARAQVQRLAAGLEVLRDRDLGQPLTVSLMLSGEGPAIQWRSTLGRELAFILSHTIHHGAMIAAMVEMLGEQVPESFGVAPSTLAYRSHRS